MNLRIVMAFFILVWMLLLSKLYYLGIRSNSYYEQLAMRNAYKQEVVFPVRGIIFDRNKIPLVVNQIGFSIDIAPNLSSKSRRGELSAEVTKLVKLFPMLDPKKLEARYAMEDGPYNHDFIRVEDFIPYTAMLPYYALLAQDPLVRVQPFTKREYPKGSMIAHALGFVAKASPEDIKNNEYAKILGYVGKAGLEKFYEKQLQGIPGVRTILVDAYNREVAEVNKTAPSKNQDLILSLDTRVQEVCDKNFAGRSGAIVVMDLATGGVIAGGSYPDYNVSSFAKGIAQDEWSALINDLGRPLTNKLTKGMYPPGSTIKPGVALSFLESGKITPQWTIRDQGYITFGGRKFRDWKSEGHGSVDLHKAIRESCDTYFYTGGSIVGIETIVKTLKRFGLGGKTGVDLPEESFGVLPDPLWKRKRLKQPWYLGDTLNTSIGQGNVLATPLQIAVYTGFIASGQLVTPRYGYSIGGVQIPTKILGRATSQDMAWLPAVREGMYAVCNEPGGTATRTLGNLPIKVAGKTGTAQVVGISQAEKTRMKESQYAYFHRSHAWLTTYAPFDKPRYVITALVEHGGHGGEAAGPMVRQLYETMYRLGYFGANPPAIGQSSSPVIPAVQ